MSPITDNKLTIIQTKSQKFPNNDDLNVSFSNLKSTVKPVKANVFNFETSSIEKMKDSPSGHQPSSPKRDFSKIIASEQSIPETKNVVSIILTPSKEGKKQRIVGQFQKTLVTEVAIMSDGSPEALKLLSQSDDPKKPNISPTKSPPKVSPPPTAQFGAKKQQQQFRKVQIQEYDCEKPLGSKEFKGQLPSPVPKDKRNRNTPVQQYSYNTYFNNEQLKMLYTNNRSKMEGSVNRNKYDRSRQALRENLPEQVVRRSAHTNFVSSSHKLSDNVESPDYDSRRFGLHQYGIYREGRDYNPLQTSPQRNSQLNNSTDKSQKMFGTDLGTLLEEDSSDRRRFPRQSPPLRMSGSFGVDSIQSGKDLKGSPKFRKIDALPKKLVKLSGTVLDNRHSERSLNANSTEMKPTISEHKLILFQQAQIQQKKIQKEIELLREQQKNLQIRIQQKNSSKIPMRINDYIKQAAEMADKVVVLTQVDEHFPEDGTPNKKLKKSSPTNMEALLDSLEGTIQIKMVPVKHLDFERLTSQQSSRQCGAQTSNRAIQTHSLRKMNLQKDNLQLQNSMRSPSNEEYYSQEEVKTSPVTTPRRKQSIIVQAPTQNIAYKIQSQLKQQEIENDKKRRISERGKENSGLQVPGIDAKNGVVMKQKSVSFYNQIFHTTLRASEQRLNQRSSDRLDRSTDAAVLRIGMPQASNLQRLSLSNNSQSSITKDRKINSTRILRKETNSSDPQGPPIESSNMTQIGTNTLAVNQPPPSLIQGSQQLIQSSLNEFNESQDGDPAQFQEKQVFIISNATTPSLVDAPVKLQSHSFSIAQKSRDQPLVKPSPDLPLKIPSIRMTPSQPPLQSSADQHYTRYKKRQNLNQSFEDKIVRLPGNPSKKPLPFEEQQRIIATALANNMITQQQMGILTQPPNKVSQACVILNSTGSASPSGYEDSKLGPSEAQQVAQTPELSKLSMGNKMQEIQCSVVTLLPQNQGADALSQQNVQPDQRKMAQTEEDQKSGTLPSIRMPLEEDALKSTVSKKAKHEIHMNLGKNQLTVSQTDDDIQDPGFGYPDPIRNESARVSDGSPPKSGGFSDKKRRSAELTKPHPTALPGKKKSLKPSQIEEIRRIKKKEVKQPQQICQSIINMNLLSDLDLVDNLQLHQNFPNLIKGNSRVTSTVEQLQFAPQLEQATVILLNTTRSAYKKKLPTDETSHIEIGNIEITQSLDGNETEVNMMTTPRSNVLSNPGNLTQRTNDSINRLKKKQLKQLKKETGEILIIGNSVQSTERNNRDVPPVQKWVDLPTQKMNLNIKQPFQQRPKIVKEKPHPAEFEDRSRQYFEQQSDSNTQTKMHATQKRRSEESPLNKSYANLPKPKVEAQMSNSTLIDDLKKQGLLTEMKDHKHLSTNQKEKKSPFTHMKSQRSEIKKGIVFEDGSPLLRDNRYSNVIAARDQLTDVNIDSQGPGISQEQETPSRQNLINGAQTTTMYKQSDIDIQNREKFMGSPFFNSEKHQNSFNEELQQSLSKPGKIQVNSSTQLKQFIKNKQIVSSGRNFRQDRAKQVSSQLDSNLSLGLQEKPPPRYHEQLKAVISDEGEYDKDPLSPPQSRTGRSPKALPKKFTKKDIQLPAVKNPRRRNQKKHSIAIQTSKPQSSFFKSSTNYYQMKSPNPSDLQDLSIQAHLTAAYNFHHGDTTRRKTQEKEEEEVKPFFMNESTLLPLFKERLSNTSTFNLLKYNDQNKVSYDRFRLFKTKDKLPKEMSKRYNSELRKRRFIKSEGLFSNLQSPQVLQQQMSQTRSGSRVFAFGHPSREATEDLLSKSMMNPFPSSLERIQQKQAERQYFSKLQKLEKERIKLLQAQQVESSIRVPNTSKGMADDNMVKESLIATVRSKWAQNTSLDFFVPATNDEKVRSRLSPQSNSMYKTNQNFNTDISALDQALPSTKVDQSSLLEPTALLEKSRRSSLAQTGGFQGTMGADNSSQRVKSQLSTRGKGPPTMANGDYLKPSFIKIQNVNPITTHYGAIKQKFLLDEEEEDEYRGSSHGRNGTVGRPPFTKEQSTSNPDISSPVSESGILEVKLGAIIGDAPKLENIKKSITENHTANQTVSSNFPLSGKDLEEAKPDMTESKPQKLSKVEKAPTADKAKRAKKSGKLQKLEKTLKVEEAEKKWVDRAEQLQSREDTSDDMKQISTDVANALLAHQDLPFQFTDNQVQLMVSKRVKKMQQGQVQTSAHQKIRTRADRMRILSIFGKRNQGAYSINKSILEKSYQRQLKQSQETQVAALPPDSQSFSAEKQLSSKKLQSIASPHSQGDRQRGQGQQFLLKPKGLAVMESPQFSAIKSPLLKKQSLKSNEDIKIHLTEEDQLSNKVALRVSKQQTQGIQTDFRALPSASQILSGIDDKNFIQDNIKNAFTKQKTGHSNKSNDFSQMMTSPPKAVWGHLMEETEQKLGLNELLENISEKSKL